MKTPVPKYFKYVLKYCGYDNAISIASIVEDDIEHFVSEVRNGNVAKYFKSINAETEAETDILEGSMRTIKTFEFSRGHIKFLMSIAMFLKTYIEKNGPHSCTMEVDVNTKKRMKNKKLENKATFVPKKKKISTATNAEQVVDTLKNMEIPMVAKHQSILIKKMLTSLQQKTPRLYAEVSKLVI